MLLLLFSGFSSASNLSPTVFYPLPTQAQGKVFAAKQLFTAQGGGIWLQDVRNQILFFDGQAITPELGSALDHDAEQVAFTDNAFWTFFQNEIYRTIPNQEKELVFSLTPGTEIQRIGSSKRFIWLADESNFYTYHVDSGEFQTFSLIPLYQYNQSSTITINDAVFIHSRWVVATNAGVYLSNGDTYEHVASSASHYVEKLHFSQKRNQLVVGSLNGVLIFDIERPNHPIQRIAGNHVLSITETDNEYWIGTEKGLFVYSFLTGETRRFEQGVWAGNGLAGEKIYSLLNDKAGGIWIATDRGVRYFSQFSANFNRYPTQYLSFTSNKEKLTKLLRRKSRDGYWMLTNKNVYRLDLSGAGARELIYQGNVHDVEEKDGILWLATDQGIVCIDSDSGEVIDDDLPNFLKQTSVRFIEVTQNNIVWGASKNQLWNYNLATGQLIQFGSEWMIKKFLPAQLTHMFVTSQGYLSLGTEHGIYILKDGQVRFVGESIPFGEVIDVEQPAEGELWIASRYGLYRLDLYKEQAQPIAMVDDHITPKCLLKNQDGVWLTSSGGLSRYSDIGILRQHYGEPFGLISNEFVAGLCSYSSDSEQVLLFGSRTSMVKIDTSQLISSELPQIQVVFSQIKRNQKLYSLANTVSEPLRLGYSESVFFQFGVFPRANDVTLEYRLEDDSDWQLLDGNTLTMEHMMPGSYQLEVRALHNGTLQSRSASYHFVVSPPWFLSIYAIIGYIVLAILLLATTAYWRSRIMSKANRVLKAQVALKTNQLRHQSRILLSNNQQLRKQLQVRKLIFTQSVNALKERLTTLPQHDLGNKKTLDFLNRELELLVNVRSTNGQALPVYNLTLIIESVLSGWQEELVKAGITVEVEAERDLFVSLTNFNLDEVFNLLFDGIVQRCYRNQTVVIQLALRNEQVVLSMLDQGKGMDRANVTMQSVATLVEKSGGALTIHTSEERNLLEMTWCASEAFAENSIVVDDNDQSDTDLEHQDPWLEKVIALVNNHYADPDFSTSSAAKMLFVSERSLQRRVKSALDKTFTEYLTEIRLDSACRRLLAGEKVSDVAFECGFNDPSYFSQRFKHRFGVSPTQFVEQRESF
ncbi:helix-turn-helix domain-containing protein [Vibrio brasiliensis]|uniref:helix-turn-helix domain-containing protein n=1 Tax=Vibrio brasiliensis TaxID=170652 RepID=UPI001EFD3C24|nr:AraC family transcriptional regulator [Vibrio brasiliensis]MCG9748969.1 helix-turn-helix domain-containing protein [Vibrio brasiliensis]